MDQEPLPIHVMPDKDFIEHIESENCQCRPDWDKENKHAYSLGLVDTKVFVHNMLQEIQKN